MMKKYFVFTIQNMKFTHLAIVSILMILFVFIGCTKEKEVNQVEKLTLLGRYDINVPEPSGLSLNHQQNGFWTVSDEDSSVYELDSSGNVTKRIIVNGFDIEGIVQVDDSTLAIVLERTREVVIIDTNGLERNRKKLDLDGELNGGLEGITFDDSTNHYFIVNEKNPSLLLELDASLNEIRRDTLKIAKDLSGIFYDSSTEIFWFLSDEDNRIIKTDKNLTIINKFKIKVTQPEGITINRDGTRIYIVSDKYEKLYVYAIE